jgi:hypothetical protein
MSHGFRSVADPVADEPSVTVPVVPVVLDRRSRRLPLSIVVALGVGAIAFTVGLHLGGAASNEAAALAATSPQPTPSAGESTASTTAVASGSPLLSPPGWSDFVRRFDAAGVIEALPGGANCRGGSPGSWIAPRTGSNPDEAFVKTWILFCSPMAPDQRDAFLNAVLDAIAPVDRPIWDGLGGVMAVTPYQEGGFVGSVTLATRSSVDVIEITVTLEERPAPFGGPTVSRPSVSPNATQTQGTATTSPVPVATPTMLVSLPAPTRPVPLPAAGALAPGTYSLANPHLDCAGACADYQRIIVTLPAGWATRDGLVYKHLDQPDEVAFSAWTVAQVYADPCHWQGSVLGMAPGALGLATRLVDQAGLKASALTDATLGDVYAVRVELPVPVQLDIATCDGGEFRRWTEVGLADHANSHYASGQIDWVYVVDVDRAPLVIDALHMPATSREDLAELDAILASMTVVR